MRRSLGRPARPGRLVPPVLPGLTRRLRRRRRDEGGVVAVFTILLVVVLMAMAAFTVDVGNWYVTSQQNQRAADAAALAGVTFMPASFADASSTALDMATRNGLPPGTDVSVTRRRWSARATASRSPLPVG